MELIEKAYREKSLDVAWILKPDVRPIISAPILASKTCFNVSAWIVRASAKAKAIGQQVRRFASKLLRLLRRWRHTTNHHWLQTVLK
jgi:hypothetical protein